MAGGKCYIDLRIVFSTQALLKTEGHMLTPKNDRSGLTWLDRPVPRLDRPGQSP
jgi:hypothetical protein